MSKVGKVELLCSGRSSGRTLQQYLEIQKWAIENGYEKIKVEFITPEYNKLQEIINYLKDLIENKYTNGKVVWFDSEYARIYGELCTMAGVGDNRLALVPLNVLEELLFKIEKENRYEMWN